MSKYCTEISEEIRFFYPLGSNQYEKKNDGRVKKRNIDGKMGT